MSNNPHSKENLQRRRAERASDQGNRHLVPATTPHGNLLVSLAQKAAFEIDKLGLSNGKVDL